MAGILETKLSSKRSVKERRNGLFYFLEGVLNLSHKKLHCSGNSDSAKRGWARVMIQGISTYSNLLEDEELEFRVTKLEDKLKDCILIPKTEEKKTI